MVIEVLGMDEVAYEDSVEYKEMGTQESLEELPTFHGWVQEDNPTSDGSEW